MAGMRTIQHQPTNDHVDGTSVAHSERRSASSRGVRVSLWPAHFQASVCSSFIVYLSNWRVGGCSVFLGHMMYLHKQCIAQKQVIRHSFLAHLWHELQSMLRPLNAEFDLSPIHGVPRGISSNIRVLSKPYSTDHNEKQTSAKSYAPSTMSLVEIIGKKQITVKSTQQRMRRHSNPGIFSIHPNGLEPLNGVIGRTFVIV